MTVQADKWYLESQENFSNCKGLRTVNVIFRNLDTAADCSLSYKELKGLLKSQTTLIDVREKWEIGQFGKIPGSINIPLGEVVEALQMNPKDFKERYNQDMPAKSDHLVFSCMAGVRSKKALDIAMSLGFSRVQHYAGGLEEWAKYEPPETKQ
ncbi:thiosulfate sulfurtransferase/rhodanese-like domain-containing protein 3 isoform X2 [Dermochelys coriacea]|uniref:thiosulfate sulfurtransferase/rhodanese-like domain-containing protein 3 isoform X2 n=1 Tax=Dermochelys coriacea TaxID=27794 RepID=UPI001CA8D948|nr:thiosulfate sulfurtransferase/rhodanese-like domain-containing protein 3 isoform X2 [Dermochelys coriacea]